MNAIQKSSNFVTLVLVLLIVAAGCKSRQKAMQASNVKSATEQEAALKKQREDEARQREAEEKARELERTRKEAEERNERAINEPKVKLGSYFAAIASSGNVTSANNSITEALAMFASPETPVLIVISEYEGGKKDYDRPTVIRDYLNYLKDQKKNINVISNLKLDSTGKITEVELRKPL